MAIDLHKMEVETLDGLIMACQGVLEAKKALIELNKAAGTKNAFAARWYDITRDDFIYFSLDGRLWDNPFAGDGGVFGHDEETPGAPEFIQTRILRKLLTDGNHDRA
jgi:hypothetical protein